MLGWRNFDWLCKGTRGSILDSYAGNLLCSNMLFACSYLGVQVAYREILSSWRNQETNVVADTL